jgi:Protein of unknown function (DUF3631)
MDLTKSIIQDAYDYLGRHVIYPNDQSRIAHTLWILGSGFLKFEDLSTFDNYPILAFLSPDEDSGKTRALDVTELLSHNSINGGSHTAASLCREIDQKQPELITIILDELDEIFTMGRDNSDYIRLLNNGYQRGKVIARCDLNSSKIINTSAYCPKAVAGLSVAKLKRTTRSRMIVIRMRPMKKGERVERHLDKKAGRELRERMEAWREIALDKLRNVDEEGLSTLTKRAAQIWHPLLSIAKIAGDDWYERALQTAAFFVDRQVPGDTLGRTIFKELFRVYASGTHRRGIHSETFAEELHQRGFSLDIDKHKIGYYLGENGYGIKTKQLKLGGINRNGYDWDACMPFFADHLSEEEREEIYQEWRGEEVDRGRGTPEREMYF